MLRRPLSTVLSSLSIGCRLSKRLFCATATSANDQIPTVRTIGSRWFDQGFSMNSIYWGEGDSRNTNVKRRNDPTDMLGTKMRSVMLVLEQARKDGLKQIRVQTDLEKNEFDIREMAQRYNNLNSTEMNGNQIYLARYSDRIVELMDEMEVTLEYRKFHPGGKYDKEVFTMFREEIQKVIDACTISTNNSPVDGLHSSTLFLGSTVRTTGSRWTEDGITHTKNGIFWGKGDPRNTKVERNDLATTHTGSRLLSIVMALEQAHKDGLKQIRVQTDLNMNAFRIRRMAQSFKNMNPTEIKDIHLAEYCERIVELLDAMEVTIEYRKPWFRNKSGNEVYSLINGDIEMQNDELSVVNSATSCSISSNRNVGGAVSAAYYSGSTVRTTGLQFEKDGVTVSLHGIYWGEGDPRNLNEKKSNDAKDLTGVQLRSSLMALEQALKDGMKQIRVQTDMGIDEIGLRRMAHQLKCTDIAALTDIELTRLGYCDRIVKIMDEMEVILEYRTTCGNRGRNEVMTMLKSDYLSSLPSTIDITPSDVSSLDSRTIPTVYVVGRRDFLHKIGVSAFLWVPESIEHLEINRRPLDSHQQLPVTPVNHFQAQMMAILNAINEARALSIPEIQVITDSLAFVHHFSREWKSKDGNSLKYAELYLEIKALCETTNVHFKGVRYTPDCDDELLKKVHEMSNKVNSLPSTIDFTPSDVSSLDSRAVPTVYVVGRRNRLYKNGGSASLWVPESIEHLEINQRPLGSIERLSVDPGTHFRVQVMAILNAIKEAEAHNLTEIRVITDSLAFVHHFSMDWKDSNGIPLEDEILYREIKALTDKIKVHFKGVRYTPDCGDELLKKVHEMAQNVYQLPSAVDASPSDLSSLDNRAIPTVYVRGKRNHMYKVGASASLWVPESIEYLEINERPLGSIQRLSADPRTHTRAQMMAILNAIKEAQALNVPEIRVITDSLPFVNFYSSDWKDSNGTTAENEDLFLEIKALTETIKVHFKGVRYTPDCDDELLKKVHEMAKEGLGSIVQDKKNM